MRCELGRAVLSVRGGLGRGFLELQSGDLSVLRAHRERLLLLDTMGLGVMAGLIPVGVLFCVLELRKRGVGNNRRPLMHKPNELSTL